MKLPLTINNNHDAMCGEIDMDEDVWVNDFLKMGHSFILSPVIDENGTLIEVSLCEADEHDVHSYDVETNQMVKTGKVIRGMFPSVIDGMNNTKKPETPACSNCGSTHIRHIYASGTKEYVGILCDACGLNTYVPKVST